MKIHRKFSPAFTIVELIVVIVVLGILAGIVIVGFGSWQTSVAKKAVQSDLQMLAAAMEDAKNFGSGYPASIPSSFSGSSKVTVTYISGDDVSYCVEAKSNTDASIVYYLFSSSKTPTQGTCASIGQGAPYTGPISYSDDFSGSGSLGNMLTGTPTVAWQALNGVSWTRSGGYANTSSAMSANPVSIVDVGKKDYKVTLGIGNGGEAIYFWVVDQQNWWRLRLEGTDTTTTDGYNAWIYNVWTSQASYNAGNPASYQNYVAQNQASMDAQASWCSSNGYVCQNTGQSTYHTYNTTSTSWKMYLDKSVGGTITAVNSYTIPGQSAPTTIGVIAKGFAVTPSYDSTTLTQYTATSPSTSRKVGVGLGGTNRATPTGPTSIAIVDAP